MMRSPSTLPAPPAQRPPGDVWPLLRLAGILADIAARAKSAAAGMLEEPTRGPDKAPLSQQPREDGGLELTGTPRVTAADAPDSGSGDPRADGVRLALTRLQADLASGSVVVDAPGTEFGNRTAPRPSCSRCANHAEHSG